MNIYRKLMTLYIYPESRALQNQELEQKAFSAGSYVSHRNVIKWIISWTLDNAAPF